MSQPPLPYSRGALVECAEWYPLAEQPMPADVGGQKHLACCWQPKLARKRPRYGIFWRHWIGSAEWKRRWHPLGIDDDEDEVLILVLLLGGERVVAHRYKTKEVEPADLIFHTATSAGPIRTEVAVSVRTETPVTLTRDLLPPEEKLPQALLDMREHFLTEAMRQGQALSEGRAYEPRPYRTQRAYALGHGLGSKIASAGLRAARWAWAKLRAPGHDESP